MDVPNVKLGRLGMKLDEDAANNLMTRSFGRAGGMIRMNIKICAIAGLFVISACSQAPVQPSANDLARASSGSPIANEKLQAVDAYNSSITAAGSSRGQSETLSGSVWLHQTPPVPLTGVPLILKKKSGADWVVVTKLMSGQNGEFVFSPALQEGEYWLGAHEKKYRGGRLFKLQPNEHKHIVVWVTSNPTAP